MTTPSEEAIRAACDLIGLSWEAWPTCEGPLRTAVKEIARRLDAEREAVPVDMPSSPNPDCEACGGEGEDADPYGMFDYDCYKPCPACYAHPPKEPTT